MPAAVLLGWGGGGVTALYYKSLSVPGLFTARQRSDETGQTADTDQACAWRGDRWQPSWDCRHRSPASICAVSAATVRKTGPVDARRLVMGNVSRLHFTRTCLSAFKYN